MGKHASWFVLLVAVLCSFVFVNGASRKWAKPVRAAAVHNKGEKIVAAVHKHRFKSVSLMASSSSKVVEPRKGHGEKSHSGKPSEAHLHKKDHSAREGAPAHPAKPSHHSSDVSVRDTHHASNNVVDDLIKKATAHLGGTSGARVPKGETVDKKGNVFLCPSGSFSVGGTRCEPCAPGTFSEAGSGRCSLCPKGTFSDASGQPSCTPCPAGLFNPRSGGSDKNACVECIAGHSCAEENTAEPKKCDAGEYSALGSAECDSCPTFFSPDRSQARCNAKASFYVATSSLSFAFFGIVGVMAGRIKKAARRSDGLEEDVLTEDEDDFFVPVNTDCDGKSVASAESSQHRIQRHSFNDYGIL